MGQKQESTISDIVSDTLFIPLYMRSLETERKDGIIYDPLACELVDQIDYDFSKYKKSRLSQLGTAIRIRHFDQAVSRFLDSHDNPVVVNIGSGLDTRFRRVFNGKGIFYELDLPEVIEFRKRFLPESDRNPYLGMSMFEPSWIELLRKKHPDGEFILVAEGVFMYFEEDQIRKLITDIADGFEHCELHFDVCSPWAVTNGHRHETVKYTNAVFKWGLAHDRDLESWSPKLHHVDTVLYFSQEFGRWGVWGVVGKVFPKMRNAFRMVQYEVA